MKKYYKYAPFAAVFCIVAVSAACLFYVKKPQPAATQAHDPALRSLDKPAAPAAEQGDAQSVDLSRSGKTPLDQVTSSLAIAREQIAYVQGKFTGVDRSRRLSNIASTAIRCISIEEGLELLSELPSGEVYEVCAATLGERFAVSNPREGIDWLKSLPQTSEYGRATMAFYNKYAAMSPADSINSLHELNPVRQRVALVAVAQQLAIHDLNALNNLIQSGDFSEIRRDYPLSIETYYLHGLAKSQGFEDAASLAAKSDAYEADHLTSVIAHWARENPEATANWMQANEPFLHGDKAVAAENLVAAWAESDAIACSAWLQHMSSGDLRDRGAKALAVAVAAKDGKAAAEWVETIQQPEVRMQAMIGVLERWSAYDKESATLWFESQQ